MGAATFFGQRSRKRLQRWQHRIEKHPFKAVMDMWNLSLMGKPGSFDNGSWNSGTDSSKPAVLAGMAFAGPDGTFGLPGLWIKNKQKRKQLEILLRKVHDVVDGADFKALSDDIRYVHKGESVFTLE